jgi:hypothetical protein
LFDLQFYNALAEVNRALYVRHAEIVGFPDVDEDRSVPLELGCVGR